MIRHGSPPFLECSGRGDRRFSAFYARPRSINGLSIEEFYQMSKVFEDGSRASHWREAKGRRAVNAEECARIYERLWREWVEQEDLTGVLVQATGLSDIFGQPGHVCQATVLWKIRSEAL